MIVSQKFLVLKNFVLFVLIGGFLFFSQNNIFAQNGALSSLNNNINITVSAVTDRSITLQWHTPEKATSVIYYGIDQNSFVKVSDNALIAQHKFTIFNLNPQTKYFVKVESVSASGSKFVSNTIEAATLEDRTRPFNVSEINIVKNEQGQAILSWKNPDDPDFKETVIKIDDEEIFRGVASEFALPAENKILDISIYTFDHSGNSSSGIIFTTQEDGLITKTSSSFGANPLDAKLVYIFSVLKNNETFLLSPVNGSAQNKIIAYSGDKLIFSINPAIFKKQIASAYIKIDGLKYLFKQNGKYLQTDITLTRDSESLFSSFVVIEFSDKTTQETTFEVSALIRPNVFSKVKDSNEPIQDTEVSLYWQNPSSGSFELWAGSLFNQTNPVLTDSNGKFGFYVLPGTYKLKAKKDSFNDYESELFTVSESIINRPIEMLKNESISTDNNGSKKAAETKNNSNTKQLKPQSFNRTIEMLPFLIFMMLGFFVIVGSIVALILLKLHLPHYHLIKKHTEEIHKDLE